MLYELLTGRPPFARPTRVETLLKVRTAMPAPPRLLAPRVDADLETICLKCLHKEPTNRYGSAAALADDLERWLRGDVIEARRAGAGERLLKWVRRNPVVAGLIAAVAVVLLVGSAVATGFGLYASAEAGRADQEAYNAQTRETEAKEALAREAEEKDLKARQLMTAQLLRVEALYERDPGRARELLDDPAACPPPLRDAAWQFYNRACRRRNWPPFAGTRARSRPSPSAPTGKLSPAVPPTALCGCGTSRPGKPVRR